MSSHPRHHDRKLLMSSVCQPFGEAYGDGFGTSFEGTHQLMWAQGIFRPRSTTTQWGIDFIAHNLKTPTTTLHYPTMPQFIAELKKGYDYVGIAFVAPTLHKMVPMVKAVREHAPGAKIVLGSYGTALPDEDIAQYADYICRGEGVAFMRELLGEPVDRPIEQPVVTQVQSLFSLQMGGRVGYLFAGLGCPNGCDFCMTSHYFKRRHIKFLPDGNSLVCAIKQLRSHYPEMVDFWLSDEDFLLNQKRGRGFLEALRASKLPPLGIATFSSVKAISQYKPSELVEMGLDWIWVGYEGQRAGYAKMDGKGFKELFSELHDHGISVMASMIIGFDYQTPEIIQQEFEDLMSLRPSMCQFLIYGPPTGTPLYARLAKDGRLDAEVMADHSRLDGYTLAFHHPTIGRDEMSSIQRDLCRQEFEILGPSVFRVADDWAAGHVNLRNHPEPRVRAKAERYGKDAHKVLSVLPASKRHLEASIHPWIDDLYARIEATTGPPTHRERMLQRVAPAALWYTDFCLRHGVGQQPDSTRRTWRLQEQTSTARAVAKWPLDHGTAMMQQLQAAFLGKVKVGA
jgi:haloalkane dehalogenase